MFRRILVPMDGTSRGTEALAIGRQLAERLDASLILLRVEPRDVDLATVIADDQGLERHAETLRQQGIDARSHLHCATPPKGIAETAAYEAADLIVMAPRRRAGLDALRHPSVTARLFTDAPAPLLIWPDTSDAALRSGASTLLDIPGSLVIVPLDGSAEAEQALPFAVAFAREYERPLLLAQVVTPIFLTMAGLAAHHLEVEIQAEQELRALRYLQSVRHSLVAAGLPSTQSMVLRGSSAAAIIRLAETHDGSLLVMSTHGRSGLSRLLAGSVATEVMRHTPLPLLVVPPHAAIQSERVLAPAAGAGRHATSYETALSG